MIYRSDKGLTDGEIFEALKESIADRELKKVLILPPDYTRMYSGAGKITSMYYDLIISPGQVVPHEVVGMANYSKIYLWAAAATVR